MKPFDLSAAVNGAPLQTRDGREVTEFCYFKTCIGSYPLGAVVDGHTENFTLTGKYEIHDMEYDEDLFLKSEKKKLRIAIEKNANHMGAHQVACFTLAENENMPENYQIVEVEILI